MFIQTTEKKESFEKERLKTLQLIQEKLNEKSIETKSDEAMWSTQDWYWQDFVPTDMASRIIERVRQSDTILSKLPTPFIMPTNPYKIPVEWWDPTFYYTWANDNVVATEYSNSKAWTDDLTLTAKKLTAVVYIEWELQEDAIVNIQQYVENKLVRAYNRRIDALLVNWDTETWSTWNINKDDWAPTTWTYYLALDWFRKNAFFQSTTYNAWTLDIADIRTMRSKLQSKWLNPNDLMLIINRETYFKILWLWQVETIEKFWWQATITNWVLTAIDWIQIAHCEDFWLTEADWKMSATWWNNTLWWIILVHKPSILVWFRRQLSLFTEYLPRVDQYVITAHVRVAMNMLNADYPATALWFNITV